MKITTQRDLIRTAPKRWRNTYEPFNNDQPLFSVRNGHSDQLSKREIADELDKLDLESATPSDVADIIGNESWTRITCDQCKKEVTAVLQVGERRDYESATANLCRKCVEHVYPHLFENSKAHSIRK